MKTCILVNAISIKEGGSLVVLRELIGGICRLRTDWDLHVVGHSEIENQLGLPSSVTIHSFPKADKSFWRTRLWYETGLISLVKRVNAKLLYSQTNYLPTRRPRCKTLLLEQHAGHFSDLFQSLLLESLTNAGKFAWKLKGRWVRSSVRRADAVTVQTRALAQRISERTGVSDKKIKVIRHGIGQSKGNSAITISSQPNPFRIGYTTKYGVQKNFDVLFAAGARLMQTGLDFRIVLTLCLSRPENQAVLKSADRHGILEKIENHGELNAQQLSQLYQSLHAFVFPSLIESFGFPMVEAMAHGLPLLAADTDSNREVADNGGEFFHPYDAENLAIQIQRLYDDPQWYRQRAAASWDRQGQLDWDNSVRANINLIESLIAGSTGSGIQQHADRQI